MNKDNARASHLETIVCGRRINVWRSGNALFGYWAVWVSVNGGWQFLVGKCATQDEAEQAVIRCSTIAWT